MIIDLSVLDERYRDTVKRIEAKPHVKYIRYLLTKGYSPISIKKELQKLGLSAPHEGPLTIYYLAVIDPIVKSLKLSYVYADYRNRLLRANNKKGDYSKNIINFRLKFGNDPDGQIKFCEFIKTLELEELWCAELYKYYGSASAMPCYENGQRIITAHGSNRQVTGKSITKILSFDKRYVIDKMLLENVSCERITKYCKDNLKLNVNIPDILLYKNSFFNVRAQTIEEKIESLVNEKGALEQALKDSTDMVGDFAAYSIGEKITFEEQTKRRIRELDNSIKGLNALYKDTAVKLAEIHERDFESMFADIVGKAYERFSDLDKERDRDVVDPLFKTVKMMIAAHDKVTTIQSNKGSAAGTDKHSQGTLLQLYGTRVEEIFEEQKQRVARETGDVNFGQIDIDAIEGIEETGISFEGED